MRVYIGRFQLAFRIGRYSKTVRINQLNVIVGPLFHRGDVEAKFDVVNVQKAAKIELGASCLDLVTTAFHLRDGLIETGNVLKIEKAFGQLNYPEAGSLSTLIG